MSTKKLFLLLIFIAVISAAYYYLIMKKTPKDLIAIVGDQKIFIQDVQEEMDRRGSHRIQNLDINQLLDEMILRSSMIYQARNANIHQQRDVVRMYENLLVGQYKKKVLKPLIDTVEFTADEIQKYYTNNIQKYTQPAKARLAIIFMKMHSKMSESKKQQILDRMKELMTKARQPIKGRGFGRLSVQYSEDQVSRYKGGDIGWVYENRSYRWDEKILKAGFALSSINEVSNIITTDKGLYIVKLLDRRPSKITPFNKVKGRIRHKLLLEKRKETERNFERDVRKKTSVQIFQNVLDQVDIPKKNTKKQFSIPTP